VTLQAGDVKIINGGLIGTDSFGAGKPGNVTVTANSLLIDGGSLKSIPGSSDITGISAGNGGSVTVRSGDLTITGGGEISTVAEGTGDAGDVTVTANSLVIKDKFEGLDD